MKAMRGWCDDNNSYNNNNNNNNNHSNNNNDNNSRLVTIGTTSQNVFVHTKGATVTTQWFMLVLRLGESKRTECVNSRCLFHSVDDLATLQRPAALSQWGCQ